MSGGADELRNALAGLRAAFIKLNGSYPLPYSQGYEAMQAADKALAVVVQPKDVAPLHLGACLTDGKLHATVMRREPNGHITVVATAEIAESSLRAHDCHAVMSPAQAPALAQQPCGHVRIDSGEVHFVPKVRDADATELVDGQKLYAAPPSVLPTGVPVAWNDAKQARLNDWFLGLPEGRQAVLIEDKWLLAAAAFEAGQAAQTPAVGAQP